MHSTIVAVKAPADDHQGRQSWAAFLATIASLESNQAARRLDQLVWLINFQESPAAFARLIDGCEKHGLTYGILPLADEPQWIPASFGQRTK